MALSISSIQNLGLVKLAPKPKPKGGPRRQEIYNGTTGG